MDEKNRIVHQLMNVGELLLLSGSEIRRVEETIDRMGRAYGAVETDVFVITSSIVVTMTFSDGQMYTQTRRIRSSRKTLPNSPIRRRKTALMKRKPYLFLSRSIILIRN